MCSLDSPGSYRERKGRIRGVGVARWTGAYLGQAAQLLVLQRGTEAIGELHADQVHGRRTWHVGLHRRQALGGKAAWEQARHRRQRFTAYACLSQVLPLGQESMAQRLVVRRDASSILIKQMGEYGNTPTYPVRRRVCAQGCAGSLQGDGSPILSWLACHKCVAGRCVDGKRCSRRGNDSAAHAATWMGRRLLVHGVILHLARRSEGQRQCQSVLRSRAHTRIICWTAGWPGACYGSRRAEDSVLA